MSEKDIAAGSEFAAGVISALKELGTGDEPLHFYAAMLGVQMGNMAAHIGQEAALAIMDVIREELAKPVFSKKEPTNH